MRLYDPIKNQPVFQYQAKAAVLDCCFADSFHSASGGLDQRLQYVDLNTRQEFILGGLFCYFSFPFAYIRRTFTTHSNR